MRWEEVTRMEVRGPDSVRTSKHLSSTDFDTVVVYDPTLPTTLNIDGFID